MKTYYDLVIIRNGERTVIKSGDLDTIASTVKSIGEYNINRDHERFHKFEEVPADWDLQKMVEDSEW